MKVQYNHDLRDFSRQLRNNSTIGEVLLWKEIRAKKLGCQFTRQKPIGRFVVDFYCNVLKLAIEIDGSSHDLKPEKDLERQQEIERLDINFLRFTERDVRNNLEGVVNEIRNVLIKRTTPAPIGIGAAPFTKGD